MKISPWILLVLAVPVLLLGEQFVKRIRVLNRFNIPAPVVGGLFVCVLILAANLMGLDITLEQKIQVPWWNWLVLTETQLFDNPSVDMIRPFLVAFFVCIGLNASWGLVKQASWQLPLFCLLAGGLTIVQNLTGIVAATALGESPLLGLLCGSISLTGGHGTAIGFSDVIVEAGYSSASVVGVAAATFGLVAAGLLGGPVGGRLLKKNKLEADKDPNSDSEESTGQEETTTGFFYEVGQLHSSGQRAVFHLIIVVLCIKAGAWVSAGIEAVGLTFPVYIGAMIVGVITRNVIYFIKPDLIQTWLVDLLASVFLGIFLSMAMMGLNLIELANAAGPMLIILGLQVLVMGLYAYFITFRVMGKDYDAAVMAAGHCGFGLGATPAAVANMKAITEKFGPAPRAFLVLPLVGAFLIDFINSLVILGYLNFVT
ncbi:MAG: sodium/glutamate symporter [Myxococcales bacterium]|nr:MAG: sodium/glutamate symporter [Myxococcales bacterium]